MAMPDFVGIGAVTRANATPRNDEEWSGALEGIKVRGDYRTSIPLWQKYVAPERMPILPFSRGCENPAGLIAEIEDFVGAKRFDGYKALDEPSHKTNEVVVPEWVVQTIKERSAARRTT